MVQTQFKFKYNQVKQDGTQVVLTGSFDVSKVTRTAEQEDGTLVVLLYDFHERVMKEPDIDPKTGKTKGFKNVRETVQSEIRLSVEDKEAYFSLTAINN